jgi:hypothetical protein
LRDPELHPQATINLLEEGGREGASTAASVGGKRNPAHRFRTTRDHQVVVPGDDSSRRKMHCLLGRSTLAIHRGSWDVLRVPCCDPTVARNVGALLPHLGHATSDDIVDPTWVNARPFHKRLNRKREEIDRMPMCERSTTLPERRPESVDDYCFTDLWTHRSSCAGSG